MEATLTSSFLAATPLKVLMDCDCGDGESCNMVGRLKEQQRSVEFRILLMLVPLVCVCRIEPLLAHYQSQPRGVNATRLCD